jgi:hypothetical protein
MKWVCLLLIVILLPWEISALPSNLTERTQKKIQHLESNGALAHPDETPTQFTEAEINAYVNSDLVDLPDGVQSVHFTGEAGTLTATARVDFDKIKAGHRSSNPLLLVFSGIHDILVIAHAHGVGHQGFVHVDSLQVDGIEVPDFVLRLFMEKYLQPNYPGIGIDSRFALPDRIDTARIGDHELTVTQK